MDEWASSELLAQWQLPPRMLAAGLELSLPLSPCLLSSLSLPFSIYTHTSLTWPSSPYSCPERTQDHDDTQQSPGRGHSEDSGPRISGRPHSEHLEGWWEVTGTPLVTGIPLRHFP